MRFACFAFTIVFWSIAAAPAPTTARRPTNASSSTCVPGLVLPVWHPQENVTAWTRVYRGSVYFLLLMYLFLGVSIVSDRFMGAIEVITSQEREITIRKKGSKEGQRIRVRVWNETVANLTLMALGSSAPEILLSVIEIAGKNFEAGDLGPGTIVGSAAYNLFVIIAICVYVIPDGQVRKIKHLRVFVVTATWSIFAYVWLYLILDYISPGRVECWESLLTFMFFPATVLTAYMADRRLKIFKMKKFRLKRRNRVIIATESGGGGGGGDDDVVEVEAEKQIEEEILEESSVTDPHHFAIILRDLKRKHSSATPAELEKLAIEELSKRTHKSKAFYRLRASKNIAGGVAVTAHPKRDLVLPAAGTAAAAAAAAANDAVAVAATKIYFDPDYYSVMENVGEFEVTVAREGSDLSHTVAVFYTTEDGTAVAGSDYVGATGTLLFQPNETRKTIKLNVIDDDIFEEDEHFYVHLTKALVKSTYRANTTPVVLGEASTATIVILDDDHCGVFGFATQTIRTSENVGTLRLEVVRSSGARGRVQVDYIMLENTAKNSRHFIQGSGTLVFENNEARKEIEIEIIEESCYEKNISFFVQLQSPEEITTEPIRSSGDNGLPIEENDISNEKKVALSGKPILGAISKIEVIIHESDEFKNTVNKLVEQEGPMVGFTSWSEQFSNALKVKVCDDESEENGERSGCDYFTHFITFLWKLLFAFVPPADMYSGYLCFVVSIAFIGVLTAIINDVASHFGCTVGLKDSVTAVTFVALGTSVPDTFASKVAAIQDSTADNSVGNVTGSNAVNVFLGLGIAWSMASFYHAMHGRPFTMDVGNLAFCVTLFCTEALVVMALLIVRRSKIIGGELGGERIPKLITTAFLVGLWIFYIAMTTMEAYGIVKGF